MTPTLLHGRPVGPLHAPERADGAARDWAEIQERMLVPLYEAVYDRLEVGAATRLLGVGCGAGLALLMAAARGAAVTGVEADERRLALARERLLPESPWDRQVPPRARGTRLVRGGPEAAAPAEEAFTVVTAFAPSGVAALRSAARLAERGSPVVLAGWGPPERCATARVLGSAAAARPAGRDGAATGRPPDTAPPASVSSRDDLEESARAAGLRPDGSGRVSCPFAYPDMDSAVRGLVSAGLLETDPAPTERGGVREELATAMAPFRRPDGSVRMDNVFRYLIARV